jgi:hypothetical protein
VGRSHQRSTCHAQPFVRVDRNDYSIAPVFADRRIELRVSQSEITAVLLDTGELACRIGVY